MGTISSRPMFMKTDNDTYINYTTIQWVKHIDDCLYVCTQPNGCKIHKDSHKICKSINPNMYGLLMYEMSDLDTYINKNTEIREKIKKEINK